MRTGTPWVTHGVTQQTTRAITVLMLCGIGPVIPGAVGAQTAQTTAHAPVDTGITVFGYGGTPPTVVCAQLRTCVFELAPHEVMTDKLLAGDTERWLFDVTTSGANGGTQLLSIKPTACGLATNLVVPTDRRVYDLTLRSLPCPAGRRGHERTPESMVDPHNPEAPYTRVFRVIVPDSATKAVRPSTHTPMGVTSSSVSAPPVPVSATRPLNFVYHWTGDGTIRWTPVLVFDDGVHVYIKLPLTGGAAVAPVLFALDEDGATAVVNYTAANGFYVTDRLARRFVLTESATGKRDRVVIENRRWQ